jgi:hypothetical protein
LIKDENCYLDKDIKIVNQFNKKGKALEFIEANKTKEFFAYIIVDLEMCVPFFLNENYNRSGRRINQGSHVSFIRNESY